MQDLPHKNELQNIYELLKPYVHRTSVLTSKSINSVSGNELFFKCENFQKTGSFKIRGAINAVLSLSEKETAKGVITHSSGNFAQALAYAAKCKSVKATIVMPENVTRAKRDAVIGYGAEIVYSGSKPMDREKKCDELIKETGAVFIHPSNDINVIKGHSSCAIEFTEEYPNLDYVFCPVGGGGLLSGILLGFHYFSPKTKIIAGEPANADDAYKSIKAGKIIPQTDPDTIADGLRTSLGNISFPIIKEFVHEIIRVSEEEIIASMRLIWERMKIIVEPSGAVSLAALMQISGRLKNKGVGIILSGGNADLNNLLF